MNNDAKVWLSGRKRGDGKTTWRLRWSTADGRTKCRSIGTDRKRAEHERAKLAVELERGLWQDTKRIGWGEFVAEHVGRIPDGANRVDAERTLRMFGEVCRPSGPRAVSYRMLESFREHLREKGNSVATRNKRFRYLRAALRQAVRRGYVTRTPMDGWAFEREEQQIPRALTADEKGKLLGACPSHQWRTFVFVALTTGCRRGELLGLTWDRVDFVNQRIVVTGTKAHRDRVQPLSAQAVAMLRELQAATLKDGGPFLSVGTESSIVHKYRAIVKRAGIVECTIHDLRRTFCTDLARLGVNQLIVQRLAGHSTAAVTAKYYQAVDDGMKRDAVAKLAGNAG